MSPKINETAGVIVRSSHFDHQAYRMNWYNYLRDDYKPVFWIVTILWAIIWLSSAIFALPLGLETKTFLEVFFSEGRVIGLFCYAVYYTTVHHIFWVVAGNRALR